MSFFDLPEDRQIGGYPTLSQLSDCSVDPATLDSEGRCVILEFPAFVLIGTYCPANRDESRDEFRISFLNALDARVRNLVAAGKEVFLTGDLNIIRDGIDTAHAAEQLKKQDMSIEQYVSTPARRLLNQLLINGRVIGERDEGRETAVMWDICRAFHPERRGMFTCWEQKINARPGNFGSRIDYVLCSENLKDWFCESNIQEGLMGSDHCPVYAILKDRVDVGGQEVNIKDLMSDGMFENGARCRDWTIKDLLPMSAKLIPEFDRRQSIKDMFKKVPSLSKQSSSLSALAEEAQLGTQFFPLAERNTTEDQDSSIVLISKQQPAETDFRSQSANSPSTTVRSDLSPRKAMKRTLESPSVPTRKKGKSSSDSKSTNPSKGQPGRGQSSLMGFFKPRIPQDEGPRANATLPKGEEFDLEIQSGPLPSGAPLSDEAPVCVSTSAYLPKNSDADEQSAVVDPIAAKESWSKLLGKRIVPRCEHNEPCISLVTKKAGVNCGRSFYMCSRPIGPSGQKEKNTQWRCGTFIWSSDWTGD